MQNISINKHGRSLMTPIDLTYLKQMLDERKQVQDRRHEENKQEFEGIRGLMNCGVHAEKISNLRLSMNSGFVWLWGILLVLIAGMTTGFFTVLSHVGTP